VRDLVEPPAAARIVHAYNQEAYGERAASREPPECGRGRRIVTRLRLAALVALGAAALDTGSAISSSGATTIYFWSDRGRPWLYTM